MQAYPASEAILDPATLKMEKHKLSLLMPAGETSQRDR